MATIGMSATGRPATGMSATRGGLGALVLAALLHASVGAQNCSWTTGATPWGNPWSATAYTENRVLSSATVGGTTSLYLGGFFLGIGGTPAGSIAAWNGSTWTALGSGINGRVRALREFDDGQGSALYVGGQFTTAGGLPANNVARWDGTAWSALGTGISGGSNTRVEAFAVFDDGSGPALYVGGWFNSAGGVPVQNIARWDGSTWSALPGLGTATTTLGGAPMVNCLTVHDDGTGPALYVGGSFNQAGGAAANYVARFNGSSWSPLGVGLDASVQSLVAFDDGSGPALYAGGGFQQAGGATASHIARWNGAAWSPLSGGLDAVVRELVVFDDGAGADLYAGGPFTVAGGAPAPTVARWDGVAWASTGAPFTGIIAFAVHQDAQGTALWAAGPLIQPGGGTTPGLARLDCGSSLGLSISQPGGAGGPVYVSNTNLVPGHEYFNFVFLPCAGAPGSSPTQYLALCPSSIGAVLTQLSLPLGVAPFHFLATDTYMIQGPFMVGPLTVDAICVDLTGGVVLASSGVQRLTIL